MIINITIYGAGAIGGWLGARLAGVGCSVSVVARGTTLSALQQNGLQLAEAEGTTTHAVRAYDRRDSYLARMDSLGSPVQLARRMLEAELLLEEKRSVDALAAIEAARALSPNLTAALRLELKIRQQQNAPEQVLALTEKLLLFGGAIQMAGAVKARKAARHARSDFLAIERERGISVSSSVMKFNYQDIEVNLLDTPDDIAKKIKRATSDSDVLPSEVKGLAGRNEAANLVGIYAVLAGKSEQGVLDEFGGKGFGAFKPALADLAVAKLGPVADTMRRLMNDPAEVDAILRDGGERAGAIAAPVMQEVRRVVGFWRP